MLKLLNVTNLWQIFRAKMIGIKLMRSSRSTNLRYLNSATAKLKTMSEMPGLSTLPLIGSLHHFLPVVGTIGPKKNFFELAGVFHEKFGSIFKLEGIFARAPMVILFEPEHFDQVYRAEEDNPLRPGFETLVYYRSELRKSTFKGVFGLTTAQGEQWRHFRTKVNPALLKPKLVKLYAPALDEIAKEAVERLRKTKDDQTFIESNFDTEVTRWSLESVAFVGLGSRIGCLRDDVTDEHPARRLMTSAKDIMELATALETRPNPWKYFATPSFKKIIKNFDMQWDLSKIYIEEAKKRIQMRGHDIPEEDRSIIEKLLAIDEKVAVMMANEMLLAGIDTVAFATIGLLYHLAKNPEKQDKLRDEIRSKEPNRRYLKACLKESLRIWPVIPANLRRASKEHVVGGYLIPKGVEIVAPNEYLSKLEKYYPQPLEFVPERWLVEKTDPLYYGNAHAMVALPFGFGVRSCIGRRVAELEIEALMVRLLDEFQVSWYGPPIQIVTKLMNAFQKPYNFTFKAVK